MVRKFRVGLGHFAVQCKGKVGIEFLLKLKKLQVGVAPGTALDHRQRNAALGRVSRDYVDDVRMFYSGSHV